LEGEAYRAAELGDWRPSEARAKLLASYPLWPDLRAAYLKARIAGSHFDATDETAVLDFLDTYGPLRPVRDLRYRYALKLASTGRLAAFLRIYQQYYQGLDIAKLDCLALQAELKASRPDRVVNRASDLWLVGTSQDTECDPVFDYMRAHNLLGTDLHRRRYTLAIGARQFSLARYLSAQLGESCRDEATLWMSARDNPQLFVSSHESRKNTATHREQLLYALEQISYKDPDTAATEWRKLEDTYEFSKDEIAATSRHIALWLARRQSPLALAALAHLPSGAIDSEVRRWTSRASLRRGEWERVIDSIASMPADEQKEEEWRYWHAKALQEIAQNDHALSDLHSLARERSYYGFLAADDLGLDYAFAHAPSMADEEFLDLLEADDALVRARELFLVGLESRGRSEWDAVISTLGAKEKLQAALLAHRWGWHSRAIAAAASAGQYDDLDIRYPLAFQASFAQYSADAGIPQSWAYGVARSESLFMSDVRSSAGAVGIMQLMPATGRTVARDIRLPYFGVTTLVDPGSNIRLGTSYLGKMLERFNRNPILATAAYNAGPANVESWLPQTDSMDARVWIENIPYNETRKYVRRVLATDVIFYWRMTGEMRRLSGELPLIGAPIPENRIARAD
jgi:soluble lytic murein transglycosylase